MNRLVIAAFAAVVAQVSLNAKDLTWVDGSTDWGLSSSYVEKQEPAAGDTVKIPSGVCAKVDDANENSWNAFAALAKVSFQGSSSSLEVTVGETESIPNVREAGCEVHYFNVTSNTRRNYGKVIKKGSGRVTFTKKVANVLATPIEVVEGILALPQDYESGGTSPNCGPITVGKNGVFMPSRPSGSSPSITIGVTETTGIWGSGVISNSLSKQRMNVTDDEGRWCEFSGRIYNVRWNSSGNVRLLGTNNEFRTEMTLVGGVTGLRKFGKLTDSDNSIGKSLHLAHNGDSGFLYLGEEADETDRKIILKSAAESFFDAGAHGEITLTGELKSSSDDSAYRKPKTYCFQGSNTVESVFSGVIADTFYSGKDMRLAIAKRGSGTWKFADNDDRTWGGELDVEAGTLRCASLAEEGVVCSLGTATNRPNAYAWKFGAADTQGLLEYVGDKDVALTGRTSVVTGLGGGLANSGSGRLLYAGGVKPLGAETNAFVVGGSSVAENIITRLSDGEGALSLIKEGTGTWTLDNDGDISGSVEVKGGVLQIRDRTKYSWYRFVIKESQNVDGDANIRITEMGLWDSSNSRVNAGLTYVTNYYLQAKGSLPSGCVAFDAEGTLHDYVTGTYYPCAAMFDDGTAIVTGWSTVGQAARKVDDTTVKPVATNSATWLPIVMHLPFGASRVASFDFANNTGSTFKNRRVGTFCLEGSVDGINWTDVGGGDKTTDKGGNVWTFAGTAYATGQSGTHTGGLSVLGGPTNQVNALTNIAQVAVADGARLVCESPAIVIKGLKVEAAGAGTIENATFAATGSLEVPDLPRGAVTLPIAFQNCVGVQNLAAWTLTSNGRVSSHRIAVDAQNRVSVVPPGMIIIFK